MCGRSACPRAARHSWSPATRTISVRCSRPHPAAARPLPGESRLRPILAPNSVLTSVGARHMRQRKLLLPPFHGDAVARYVEMIERVVQRELDTWQAGQTFPLSARMQAVTLEV